MNWILYNTDHDSIEHWEYIGQQIWIPADNTTMTKDTWHVCHLPHSIHASSIASTLFWTALCGYRWFSVLLPKPVVPRIDSQLFFILKSAPTLSQRLHKLFSVMAAKNLNYCILGLECWKKNFNQTFCNK